MRRSSSRRSSVNRRRSSDRGDAPSKLGDAPDPLGDALRVWSEQVRPALSAAWSFVSPVFATVWIYSALLWAFVLSWVGQRALRAYDENQEEAQRMSKLESALAHGRLFHETTGTLVMRMNPFWSRSVVWEVPRDEIPGRSIWMANHLSYADPFVLLGVLPESKAVGKGDLFDLPLAGDIFRNNGDMAVKFWKFPDGHWGTKPGSKEALMDQAREYLANDVPVALFPEGTITRTGALYEFKPGFFKLAVEEGVPVVPIAMWGNQEAWPIDLNKHLYSTPHLLLYPAEIHIRVGKPIDVSGMSVDEARNTVKDTIDRMTRALPNYSLRPYQQ